MVVLLAVGGVLLILSAGRPWATGVLTQVPGQPQVAVTGRAAAPWAAALGFVALAGTVVAATSRPAVVRVSALIIAVLGAAAAVTSVLSVRSPAAALRSSAVQTAGVSDAAVAAASRTVWPFVAVLASLLVLLAGGVAVGVAGSWTASRRFERGEVTSHAGATGLAGATGTGDGATGTGAGAAGTGDGASNGEGSPHDAAMDTWDALSRGEDPT